MNRALIITGGNINCDIALNLREGNEPIESLLSVGDCPRTTEKLAKRVSCGFLKDQLFDNIIAVDGGISKLHDLGLAPTYLIGDFDTVDPILLQTYKAEKTVKCIQLYPEKDQTDTQEAMDLAIQIKSDEIVILGGFGTRMDHTLSNIYLLEMALKNHIAAYMIDERNKLYLIDKGITLNKGCIYGPYVSLLPYTDCVRGVDLIGFKYPLNEYDFKIGTSYGIGISNEIVDDEARIEFDEGILIVIEAND